MEKNKEIGSFLVLDKGGEKVFRNLREESNGYTQEKYLLGEFDALNYVWYENFDFYIYDSIGCDYERMGCFIKEGDVVLDIGSNLGVFERRARSRGASRVICFEPVTPTYECLIENVEEKRDCFNIGIAGSTKFMNFELHTDFTQVGGGSISSLDQNYGRDIIYTQKNLCLGVNELFEGDLFERADFMKIDIEGGEVDLLTFIKDEHLLSLRCIACEFHNIFSDFDFDEFQNSFISRCQNLGFDSFVLYHGDGNLRTVNLWKRE